MKMYNEYCKMAKGFAFAGTTSGEEHSSWLATPLVPNRLVNPRLSFNGVANAQ